MMWAAKMILWQLFVVTAVTNAYTTLSNNFGGSYHKRPNKNWNLVTTTSASRRPNSIIRRKLNWGSDLDFSVALYDLQLILETKISQELSNPTFASLGFITGLSPCSLGMLPVTLSYLGSSDRRELPYRSFFYAFGMAMAFTGLGLSAALAGQLFGEISVSADTGSSFTSTAIAALSGVAKLLVSTIYLVMGLNLLNVIDVQFPSLERAMSGLWTSSSSTPAAASSSSPLVWSMQAMVLGATASVISSPCSSPVLAALLTFVSSAPSVYVGALLLLLFSLGYASPVVAAGVAAATSSAARADPSSPIAAPSSSSSPSAPVAVPVTAAAPVYEVGSTVMAALLVSYGTYSALSSARDIFLS